MRIRLLGFLKSRAYIHGGDIERAEGTASRQARRVSSAAPGPVLLASHAHAIAQIDMPFRHGQHRNHPDTNQQDTTTDHHGALSGIYQAAQTLGSVGAPTGNLRLATSGTTSAGTDDLYFSTGSESVSGGENRSYSMASGYQAPGGPNTAPPASAPPHHPSHFETPKRMQSYGRQPEELHITPSDRAVGDMHRAQSQYQSSPAYGGNAAPAITLEQSTPHQFEFSSQQVANIPGVLQPGPLGRPGPSSSNTAPSSIPTLPQISTQQPATPSRSATLSQTHSYSRSSPAGFEQQTYKPFTNNPENSKYATPGTSNYPPQTPQSSAYSPLGLADIRPRTNTGLSDGPTSPGLYPLNGELQIPTNSSYVAPWSIYALDWCKWPAQPNSTSAGKIAMGSYLEDSHNFVSVNINSR